MHNHARFRSDTDLEPVLRGTSRGAGVKRDGFDGRETRTSTISIAEGYGS